MHTGYFDGATNPNPGELGLGACIVDHKGDEVIATSSYRPYGTNNEAEYLSLILLLKMVGNPILFNFDHKGLFM